MELNRATDNIDQALVDLIVEENDPGKRATLLVLQSMSLNLSANTMALNALSTEINDHKKDFKEHRDEFKVHSEQEKGVMSQVKGGSRVFMYFMGVIQTVVFASFGFGIHSFIKLSEDLHDTQISVSAYHAKVDQLVETHKGKQ